MADILELADAVAASLEGAEVSFAPEYDLKGLKTKKIIVVPVGIESKPTARDRLEEHLKIHIGLLKRCTEDDVPDLVREVVRIGQGFLQKHVGGMRCVKTEYVPLYAPEHLRERRQFTGVIQLTFLSVHRNEAGDRV